MAATVEVETWTGGSAGSPNKTTAADFRYRTDDSPTTKDRTNPLVQPDTGQNYSYWQHTALAISGTFDEVSNIRFFTDGSVDWALGTDGYVQRGAQDSGDQGCPEGSYEPATGTTGETGDDLAANHSYFSGQTTPTTNVENDTSGSPATIDSNTYTSSTSTKAVVTQAIVDTDATSGVKSDETFTFRYDEI